MMSTQRENVNDISSAERVKSSIYTRRGDDGTSGILGGERRAKTDIIFQSLGDTDELNSHAGLARQYCIIDKNGLDEQILSIQSHLMTISSLVLASPHDVPSSSKSFSFDSSFVDLIEKWIDFGDAKLESLTNFVLPSGGVTSCQLQICRSVCRRAERTMASLYLSFPNDENRLVLQYFNRLSDWLFVAARLAAKENLIEWEPASQNRIRPKINRDIKGISSC